MTACTALEKPLARARELELLTWRASAFEWVTWCAVEPELLWRACDLELLCWRCSDLELLTLRVSALEVLWRANEDPWQVESAASGKKPTLLPVLTLTGVWTPAPCREL